MTEAEAKVNGKGTYLCYTITHEYKVTYVGITNNFEKRIKQHNGVMKGGAKATRKYDNWKLAFYVTGFRTKGEVLSFEWHMHHPEGRRWRKGSDYKGFLGRIRGLCDVLLLPKFAELAPLLKCHITTESKAILQGSMIKGEIMERENEKEGEKENYYDILSTFIEIQELEE